MQRGCKKKEKGVLHSVLAGSFSGTCSVLLFQPLDLIKTRLQEPSSLQRTEKLRIFQTLRLIVKENGIRGLWKGCTPSLVRCVPGVGMYFGAVHFLTSLTGNPTATQSLLIGLTSRSLVCTIMLPITVVKTRFESGQYMYGGVVGALRSISQLEGAKGLFSGLSATIVRDVPFSGLYLMIYRQLKNIAPHSTNQYIETATRDFICGVIAGIIGSTISQPADVTKTCMQVERYNSIRDAMKFIVQSQGLSGFFRGLAPRALRRTLVAAMTWTVYEQIMSKQ